MVSLLFAGIARPLFKRSVMPKLLTQVGCLQPLKVAGHWSESWPASHRNGGRLQVGIPGRI